MCIIYKLILFIFIFKTINAELICPENCDANIVIVEGEYNSEKCNENDDNYLIEKSVCNCFPNCEKRIGLNNDQVICDNNINKCAPGLLCDSGICVLDTDSCFHYNFLKPPIYANALQWKPKCLPDGTYAPVQCKGEKPTGKCFCADAKGARIFGEQWWRNAENMTCECSRYRADLIAQGRSDVTIHCDLEGNYEPLQCDSGICWCAEKDGYVTSVIVPQQLMEKLPCYNASIVGNGYLRICESEAYALIKIKEELATHGTNNILFSIPKCDSDGSFGNYQFDPSRRYILCLALGDLLVILTSVPFTSTVYTVDTWPFGLLVCKMSESAKDISIGVSVFTLTALSADRFFAIVDPLKRLHTSGGTQCAKRVPIIVSIIIWTLSIIFAIPGALGSFLKQIEYPTKVIEVCYPFPDEWGPNYPKIVILLRFLIYYAIPLTIIGVFYALIARHLILSVHNVPGEMQGAHRQVRARRKVAVTVLAFVVVFAICFLPYHIFMLWFYFHPNSSNDYNAFWHYLRIIGFCLNFLNSCANPVALYCVSGAFRKHFNRYLLCRNRQNVRSRSTTNTYRRANSMSLTMSRMNQQSIHGYTTTAGGGCGSNNVYTNYGGRRKTPDQQCSTMMTTTGCCTTGLTNTTTSIKHHHRHHRHHHHCNHCHNGNGSAPPTTTGAQETSVQLIN